VRHGTIAELAVMVRRGGPETSRAPVVVLRPGDGGGDQPLFLFHPIGGTVFCYVELTRHLPPGRAVLAVEAPGIETLGEAEVSVEEMLRPASCPRPAGVSPVRVDTGVPGSRPRFVVETRRAERGVESLFGGSKIAGRSATRRESCSLVRPTMGEPSRSSHGEGHVRHALVRGSRAGSLRGTGSGT
jgi:hypothetical protein